MAIEIIDTLVQKNNGEFPLIDSNNVKGGYYQVENLEERDDIPSSRRKEGMLCYVKNDKVYQLIDGIENGNWIEFKIGNDFSGNYEDLKNKPTIPSKTSDLINDSGYITLEDINTSQNHTHGNKEVIDTITSEKIESWDNKSNFDGDYNSLKNKPIIPSIEGLVTKDEVEELKTTLEEHLENHPSGEVVTDYGVLSDFDEIKNLPSDVSKTTNSTNVVKQLVDIGISEDIITYTQNNTFSEVQQLRGVTDKISEYKGKQGQIVVNIDDNSIHVMDGINKGGTKLATESFVLDNTLEVDLSDYYTKEEVDNRINEIECEPTDLSNYYNKTEIDKKMSELTLSGSGVAFRDIIDGETFFVEDVMEDTPDEPEDTPDEPPVIIPPEEDEEEEPPSEEPPEVIPPANPSNDVNVSVVNVDGVEYFKIKDFSYVKGISGKFFTPNSYKNDKYQLYGMATNFKNQINQNSDNLFNGLIPKAGVANSNALLNSTLEGVCYAVINGSVILRLPLDLGGYSNVSEYIKGTFGEFYFAKNSSCSEKVIDPSLITSISVKLNNDATQYAQFGYSDLPSSNIYSGIVSLGFNTGTNANLTSSVFTPTGAMSTSVLSIRFKPGTFEEFTLDNVKKYLEDNTLVFWY